jgi:hypothetical protein
MAILGLWRGGRRTNRQLRRAIGRLQLWRARRPGAGLRHEHPQEPRLGISSGGHSGHDTALRHVATEPSLHRHYPRQAAGCVGWTEKGNRHRGAQRLGPAALVEAGGTAECGRLEALCQCMMSGVTAPLGHLLHCFEQVAANMCRRLYARRVEPPAILSSSCALKPKKSGMH